MGRVILAGPEVDKISNGLWDFSGITDISLSRDSTIHTRSSWNDLKPLGTGTGAELSASSGNKDQL